MLQIGKLRPRESETQRGLHAGLCDTETACLSFPGCKMGLIRSL